MDQTGGQGPDQGQQTDPEGNLLDQADAVCIYRGPGGKNIRQKYPLDIACREPEDIGRSSDIRIAEATLEDIPEDQNCDQGQEKSPEQSQERSGKAGPDIIAGQSCQETGRPGSRHAPLSRRFRPFSRCQKKRTGSGKAQKGTQKAGLPPAGAEVPDQGPGVEQTMQTPGRAGQRSAAAVVQKETAAESPDHAAGRIHGRADQGPAGQGVRRRSFTAGPVVPDLCQGCCLGVCHRPSAFPSFERIPAGDRAPSAVRYVITD